MKIASVAIVLVVAMVAPLRGDAALVTPYVSVTTPHISPSTASRYVYFTVTSQTSNGSSISPYFVYPSGCGGRLVDIVIQQRTAGTTGTSWTLDLRNKDATSLFVTAATGTQASGNYQSVDAKGEVDLPSGWTRPVIKTDSTVSITKGTSLYLYVTESGSYGTHPTLIVTLVFDPSC